MNALLLVAGIVLGVFFYWLLQDTWPFRHSRYYYDQRPPYRVYGPPIAPAYDPYRWEVRRPPPPPCGMPCG